MPMLMSSASGSRSRSGISPSRSTSIISTRTARARAWTACRKDWISGPPPVSRKSIRHA